MNKFILFILFGFITLFSCKKDDIIVEPVNYTTGIFVVNQGPFQNGTGTITFRNEGDTIQDVFGRANPGKVLGNIAQSMIKFDNKYFIAVNNGAKIQVVNASDFTSVGVINGIDQPRYFCTDGKKLYVSAWGADAQSGVVHEIDVTNLKLLPAISVGDAPEQMLISSDKLYVPISSPYLGSSTKIAVIDIKTNKLIKYIVAGDSPSAIVQDKNNDIWVICSGNYNPDPLKTTNGSLHKITDDVAVSKYKLGIDARGLAVNATGDKLYFLQQDEVYVHDVSDAIFENESVADGYFNALAIQKSTNRLYLANAKDFQSPGEASFIHPETFQTGRFECGIIPGFFYFAE
ncbi:MAG: hypothetical protein IPO92_06770 [Saprospiraceae bacterium]|nr:hypothetical protein [Saprospiraceae bacterium]